MIPVFNRSRFRFSSNQPEVGLKISTARETNFGTGTADIEFNKALMDYLREEMGIPATRPTEEFKAQLSRMKLSLVFE